MVKKLDEETKKRIREAKDCHSCLGWHKYCGSECCRQIVIKNPDMDLFNTKRDVFVKVEPNKLHYYMIRGCTVRNGYVRIKRCRCKYDENENLLRVRMKCSYLSDNLCLGHPDRKPFICKDLCERTAQEHYLTPNCLFKYKLMEVEEDGE